MTWPFQKNERNPDRREDESVRDYQARKRQERAYEEFPLGSLVTLDGYVENEVFYEVLEHTFEPRGRQRTEAVCALLAPNRERTWTIGNKQTWDTSSLRVPNPLIVLALSAL